MLVPVAARPKTRNVFVCSNIGIKSSNPARGMGMCPRFFALCCLVLVDALRRADPPSKVSYQTS